MGDKGYIGKGMVTPIRKPECRDLLDWEKEFSTQVNKIRYMIEQVIANFKTWGIMHTDHRRPIGTFDTTIPSRCWAALLPDGVNKPHCMPLTVAAIVNLGIFIAIGRRV